MRELDYGKMGMRIRQVRKAKGWSQDELAKKCGISMSFLGHIERGTRIMSMETFAGICLALDAGADELLWGVASPSDAVLEMWNLPDKAKNKKKAGSRTDGKWPDESGHGKKEADANGPDGKEPDKKEKDRKKDSYAMYVKIMKSVAEIMNEA